MNGKTNIRQSLVPKGVNRDSHLFDVRGTLKQSRHKAIESKLAILPTFMHKEQTRVYYFLMFAERLNKVGKNN